MHAAPADDPRHTDACLTFGALAALADGAAALTTAQGAHADTCHWCRQSVALFRQTKPVTVAKPGSVPETSWTAALQARLAAWVREAAAPAAAPEPGFSAQFDDSGTLRIQWEDLPGEGTVTVSLRRQEVALPLAFGTVTGGVLRIEQPMADLGLRNVRLPRSALTLEPGGHEGRE